MYCCRQKCVWRILLRIGTLLLSHFYLGLLFYTHNFHQYSITYSCLIFLCLNSLCKFSQWVLTVLSFYCLNRLSVALLRLRFAICPGHRTTFVSVFCCSLIFVYNNIVIVLTYKLYFVYHLPTVSIWMTSLHFVLQILEVNLHVTDIFGYHL